MSGDTLPYFQHAFLALLAMALHEWKFLIAIDRKSPRHCGGELDRPAVSRRNFLSDVQSGLRVIDDDIMRHYPRYALEGQFDRLPGDNDMVVRS